MPIWGPSGGSVGPGTTLSVTLMLTGTEINNLAAGVDLLIPAELGITRYLPVSCGYIYVAGGHTGNFPLSYFSVVETGDYNSVFETLANANTPLRSGTSGATTLGPSGDFQISLAFDGQQTLQFNSSTGPSGTFGTLYITIVIAVIS